MAKRNIQRAVEDDVPAGDGQVQAVDVTPAPAVKVPVVVKPLDVSVTFSKLPAYMAIRVLRQIILFNDGNRMRRENLVPGKPITVRITQ